MKQNNSLIQQTRKITSNNQAEERLEELKGDHYSRKKASHSQIDM